MKLTCPICARPLAGPAASGPAAGAAGPDGLPEYFPFCSKRCRMLDLGRWFDGHYRIPGSPVDNIEGGAEAAPDGYAGRIDADEGT
jgi:uncharacterized protein